MRIILNEIEHFASETVSFRFFVQKSAWSIVSMGLLTTIKGLCPVVFSVNFFMMLFVKVATASMKNVLNRKLNCLDEKVSISGNFFH